jgi:3-isopropylmalate/(R)-2-methylmalate dehydratase small subunit
MEAFTVLEGVAAPLLRPNINTDIIIRIERLRDYEGAKLGPYCFESWRYRRDGSEDPAFVLNKPQYREARIMIGGENFACGSSREAAVWALQSFGIRCVIAPSFGAIFFTNCFQNGVLPVVVPAKVVEELPPDEQPLIAVRQAKQPDTKANTDLNQPCERGG